MHILPLALELRLIHCEVPSDVCDTEQQIRFRLNHAAGVEVERVGDRKVFHAGNVNVANLRLVPREGAIPMQGNAQIQILSLEIEAMDDATRRQ